MEGFLAGEQEAFKAGLLGFQKVGAGVLEGVAQGGLAQVFHPQAVLYPFPWEVALEGEFPGEGGLGQEDLHAGFCVGQWAFWAQELCSVDGQAFAHHTEGHFVAAGLAGAEVELQVHARAFQAGAAQVAEAALAWFVSLVGHGDAEAGFFASGHLWGEGFLFEGEGGRAVELYLGGFGEGVGEEPALEEVGACRALELQGEFQGAVFGEGGGEAGGAQGFQLRGQVQEELGREEARVGGGGAEEEAGGLAFGMALGLGGEGEVYLGADVEEGLALLAWEEADFFGAFHFSAFHLGEEWVEAWG